LLSGLGGLVCGAFVAWLTVNLGLASNVEKYGLEYPAVRFLLGPNRGDLLTTWHLLARWGVVYLGFVSVVAIGQIGAQVAAGPRRRPHRSGFPAFPAWAYGGLWLLWLLLIGYGSGFPFVSLDRSVGAAWAAFSSTILTPTRWDNGDMAVNTMMQVILGFLGAGMLWPRRSGFPKASAAIACGMVILGGLAIALGLEFMQVWLIHRTVSIHDVVCQTIGAGIGLALWGSFGPELDGWLARMGRVLPANRRGLVILILLMLAAYELYPYAPRFKAGYVWAKIRGSLVSLGYGGAPGSKMAGLAALQLLIYAPLGAAAALRPRARTLVRPVLVAGASCFVVSGAFELTKLLLPGRGTTLIDPCLAGVGGMIGGVVSAGFAARKAMELPS
jgi:VanZ family protein